ncbi:MAG: hypothetical protein V4591_09220 [Bdellovibrionota bacterium]
MLVIGGISVNSMGSRGQLESSIIKGVPNTALAALMEESSQKGLNIGGLKENFENDVKSRVSEPTSACLELLKVTLLKISDESPQLPKEVHMVMCRLICLHFFNTYKKFSVLGFATSVAKDHSLSHEQVKELSGRLKMWGVIDLTAQPPLPLFSPQQEQVATPSFTFPVLTESYFLPPPPNAVEARQTAVPERSLLSKMKESAQREVRPFTGHNCGPVAAECYYGTLGPLSEQKQLLQVLNDRGNPQTDDQRMTPYNVASIFNAMGTAYTLYMTGSSSFSFTRAQILQFMQKNGFTNAIILRNGHWTNLFIDGGKLYHIDACYGAQADPVLIERTTEELKLFSIIFPGVSRTKEQIEPFDGDEQLSSVLFSTSLEKECCVAQLSPISREDQLTKWGVEYSEHQKKLSKQSDLVKQLSKLCSMSAEKTALETWESIQSGEYGDINKVLSTDLLSWWGMQWTTPSQPGNSTMGANEYVRTHSTPRDGTILLQINAYLKANHKKEIQKSAVSSFHFFQALVLKFVYDDILLGEQIKQGINTKKNEENQQQNRKALFSLLEQDPSTRLQNGSYVPGRWAQWIQDEDERNRNAGRMNVDAFFSPMLSKLSDMVVKSS